MEELVTLDCLFIDGTKIEANANKYSFVWKKTTEKFSAKLQEQIQVYFQEEITPLLIKYAMFDKKQKRGYKESAKNLANWHYNDKEDSYIHPDGWCYRFHHIKYQHRQTFNRKSRFTTLMNLNQPLKRDCIWTNAIKTWKLKNVRRFYLPKIDRFSLNARLMWNLSLGR